MELWSATHIKTSLAKIVANLKRSRYQADLDKVLQDTTNSKDKSYSEFLKKVIDNLELSLKERGEQARGGLAPQLEIYYEQPRGHPFSITTFVSFDLPIKGFNTAEILPRTSADIPYTLDIRVNLAINNDNDYCKLSIQSKFLKKLEEKKQTLIMRSLLQDLKVSGEFHFKDLWTVVSKFMNEFESALECRIMAAQLRKDFMQKLLRHEFFSNYLEVDTAEYTVASVLIDEKLLIIRLDSQFPKKPPIIQAHVIELSSKSY